ncbi:MAG: PHP domain-containing protein [Clostridia bacterium]|nr:PHP domain-containing protein [Clostridia bacterium]
MKPDLHLHSTMSDGMRKPEDLYALCVNRGITHMSLTDHDTYAGLDVVEKIQGPIHWIPGIELSLKPMRSFHLLLYGDGRKTRMQDKVETLHAARNIRAVRMMEKLEQLGLVFPDREHEWLETAVQDPIHSVGRAHMARLLVKYGYVRSVDEAFERYLLEGRPGYVEQERMGMDEALDLAGDCGLIPVLAHPREINVPEEQLEVLVRTWKARGLMGMEVYHPSARSRGFDGLLRMARRYDLLVTGGSDYHEGEDDHHVLPGDMVRDWQSVEEDMTVFLTLIEG